MFLNEGEPQGCGPHVSAAPLGPKRYPGGSAAQSALIHTLDVFLNIHHHPTGTGPQAHSLAKSSEEHKVNFLLDMQYHLPRKYRRWLRDLESAPSIRGYLMDHQKQCPDNSSGNGVEDAIKAFDACVDAMRNFRDKHIQIVTRYIIIQARRAVQTGQEIVSRPGYHGMGPDATKVIKLADEEMMNRPVDGLVQNDGLGLLVANDSDRGTGGTNIIPFLKQSRDETASATL
jgi:indoleamine 2,3-dioxygenase